MPAPENEYQRAHRELKAAWKSRVATLQAEAKAIEARLASLTNNEADASPLRRRLDNLTRACTAPGSLEKRPDSSSGIRNFSPGRVISIFISTLRGLNPLATDARHYGYNHFAIAAHYGLPFEAREELTSAIRSDFAMDKVLALSDEGAGSRGGLGMGAGAGESTASSCPLLPAPLLFLGNKRGLGNRLGWALTAAAVAEAANAPAILSYWPGASAVINGDVYEYREVSRLVHFPHRMRFVEDRVLRVLGSLRRHEPSPKALHSTDLERLSQAVFEYIAARNATPEVPPPWRSKPYINDCESPRRYRADPRGPSSPDENASPCSPPLPTG